MSKSKNVAILNSKNELVGTATVSQSGEAIALRYLAYLREAELNNIVLVFHDMTAHQEEVRLDATENPFTIITAIPHEVKVLRCIKTKTRKRFLTPINELIKLG